MSRDNEITWQKKLLANLPPPAIWQNRRLLTFGKYIHLQVPCDVKLKYSFFSVVGIHVHVHGCLVRVVSYLLSELIRDERGEISSLQGSEHGSLHTLFVTRINSIHLRKKNALRCLYTGVRQRKQS